MGSLTQHQHQPDRPGRPDHNGCQYRKFKIKAGAQVVQTVSAIHFEVCPQHRLERSRPTEPEVF